MMRRLFVTLLFVLFTVALFVHQAEAQQYGEGLMAGNASMKSFTASGPLATGNLQELLQWLIYKFKQYVAGTNHVWNPAPRGSVPVPETLLLLGAGFAGLVAWNSTNKRR